MENLEPTNQKESVLLSWKSPDFTEYARGWKWFALFGLGFLLLESYFVYIKDWYMAVIFVILAGLLYWYQTQKPNVSSFRITQLGVYLNDKFYPYNEVHSFWMFLEQEPKKLVIMFRKAYLPPLIVLIQSVDPLNIRENLSKFIPEQTDRREQLVDKLSRWLRI